MSEFVPVKCSIPMGIVLRNYEEAPQNGMEEKRFVPVGGPVELKPGVNQVDKKFFDTWLAANSDNDLVINGLIEGPQLEKK